MSLPKRVLVLACAAFAYWCVFQPSTWLRDQVLEAFGNPPYQGVWVLIPHMFLYSTLAALVAALLWLALSAARLIPPLQTSCNLEVLLWGLVGGGVGLAVTLGFFEV